MSQSKQYSSQSGGVISYVVIGVVLAALLVGVVAIMKWRGESAANSAKPVTETSVATKNPGQPQSSPQTQPSTAKPSTPATPQPSTQTPAPQSTAPSSTTGSIAATGPKETLLTTLALGLLTATGVQYVQSRRRQSL